MDQKIDAPRKTILAIITLISVPVAFFSGFSILLIAMGNNGDGYGNLYIGLMTLLTPVVFIIPVIKAYKTNQNKYFGFIFFSGPLWAIFTYIFGMVLSQLKII